MKFTFPNKGEFEANIITDILNSEKISYKTKLLGYNSVSIKLYDITTSDISYEHYLFVKTLAEKKIQPYITAVKSFELPSFDKDKKEEKEVQPVPLSINATISVSENTPVLEVQELFKQLDKDLTNAFISIQAKSEKKENKVKSFFKNILKGICE